MDEIPKVIKGVTDWKSVRSGGLSAKLLNVDHPEFIQCFHNTLVNVWLTGEVSQK